MEHCIIAVMNEMALCAAERVFVRAGSTEKPRESRYMVVSGRNFHGVFSTQSEASNFINFHFGPKLNAGESENAPLFTHFPSLLFVFPNAFHTGKITRQKVRRGFRTFLDTTKLITLSAHAKVLFMAAFLFN